MSVLTLRIFEELIFDKFQVLGEQNIINSIQDTYKQFVPCEFSAGFVSEWKHLGETGS